MNVSRKSLAIWWLAPALSLGLGAQKTAAPAQNPNFTKVVREVPLIFTAVDTKNRFVSGLEASQIQILDDKRPQKIVRFDAQHNLPLRIALLLDVSNSISDRWQFEQQAALDFLQSILVPGRDQAMVVAFDSAVNVIQDFTDNFDKLTAAVHSERPGGGTAFDDALYLTAHDKLATLGREGEVRNVIIAVTDGDDNQSRYSFGEAMEEVQSVGAVAFSVGTSPTGTNRTADSELKSLATGTGGNYYFPVDTRELSMAFGNIFQSLRNQYLVSYTPDNFIPNGAFHAVEIRVLVKGVLVRVRKGYYASPAPPG